jgi:hypothetical protein
MQLPPRLLIRLPPREERGMLPMPSNTVPISMLVGDDLERRNRAMMPVLDLAQEVPQCRL